MVNLEVKTVKEFNMFSTDVKQLVKEYLYGSMFHCDGVAISHDNVSRLVELIFDDLIKNGSKDVNGNISINIGSYVGTIKKVI
jgi:hypothetical protein